MKAMHIVHVRNRKNVNMSTVSFQFIMYHTFSFYHHFLCVCVSVCTDSDIPSGGTSTTTITTITTTTSTTWLQQQRNNYHKQAGLFPIFMSTLFSTLVVIETIVRTVVSKTITVLKSASSSVGSKVSSAGYSLGELWWLTETGNHIELFHYRYEKTRKRKKCWSDCSKIL